MFKLDYTFYGKYAEYAKTLVGMDGLINYGDKKGLIEHGYDLLYICPIIGAAYNIKGDLKHRGDQEFNIKAIQIIRNKDHLEKIFRMIVLTEKEREITNEERIKRIFSELEVEDLEYEKNLFEGYLLGGLEWLHTKLVGSGTKELDYLRNIKRIIETYSVDFSIIDEELLEETPRIYGNTIK